MVKFNKDQANEVKVGIIGYTTEETPDISDTGSLIFNDVVETIRAESDRLRNKEWVRIAKCLFCVFPAHVDIYNYLPRCEIFLGVRKFHD